MGTGWLKRAPWKGACHRCNPRDDKPMVDLIVLEEDRDVEIVEVHCVKGHVLYCEGCERRGLPRSTKFRIVPKPPNYEISCSQCARVVKNLPQSDTQRRPKRFVPDEATRQLVFERDRGCRFCNFEVAGMVADALVERGYVPDLQAVDKVVQRMIAEQSRVHRDQEALTLFDVPGFLNADDSRIRSLFYGLTDPYAQAAAVQGQRMLHCDHLLGVQFIRPIENLFTDEQLEFLGQKCIVLSCNLCNNQRKTHLEDEPRLLELYVRIFLSGYRRIPADEYKRFRYFAQAVRIVYERVIEPGKMRASS